MLTRCSFSFHHHHHTSGHAINLASSYEYPGKMASDAQPTETPSQIAKFRVSLNQIDYTVAPPGPLDNATLPAVPILRIYGNSSTGQKTCLHIHQVYPYCYIDYTGSLSPKDGMSPPMLSCFGHQQTRPSRQSNAISPF